jgi:hypothetical protein
VTYRRSLIAFKPSVKVNLIKLGQIAMLFTELEAALFARKRKFSNRIELLPKVKSFLDSIARNSIKSEIIFLWPLKSKINIDKS